MSILSRCRGPAGPMSHARRPRIRRGRGPWMLGALLGTILAAEAAADAPRRPAPSATLYQVPVWVLGRDHCSATQISPRVALTTYACAVGALSPAGDGRVQLMQRVNRRPLSGRLIEDRLLRNAPPAGLQLILLDEPPSWEPLGTTGAPIPSYRRERELLRDPAAPSPARWEGTRLYAYGPTPTRVDRTDTPMFIRSYHGVTGSGMRFGDEIHLPLTYRSLDFHRRTEPERFASAPGRVAAGTDVLGEDVTAALGGRDDVSRADRWLIPLVGTAADGITRTERPMPLPGQPAVLDAPFLGANQGAGLMATRASPEDEYYRPGALVGLLAAPGTLHLRLALHWPEVHRVMLAQGLQADAAHLARQVLDAKLPGNGNAESGAPGDIFESEDSRTGVTSFYRLKARIPDGSYWWLPKVGNDSDPWWEPLGTALPTRWHVLGWRAPQSGRAPEVDDMPAEDPAVP